MRRPENVPPLAQAMRELAQVRKERAASELAAERAALRELRENLNPRSRGQRKYAASRAAVKHFNTDPFTQAQTELALRILSDLDNRL